MNTKMKNFNVNVVCDSEELRIVAVGADSIKFVNSIVQKAVNCIGNSSENVHITAFADAVQKAAEGKSGSYFPIRIKYTDDDTTEIVYRPEALPHNKGFKVIETGVLV